MTYEAKEHPLSFEDVLSYTSQKSKTKKKTSSNRDDRPLGGDCWERTFIFIQVSVITFCNKMITTTSTKNKER